ncbi:MAG: LamG domain-containing protein, partial [Planctomycetota bacterium]|nr:LamG domain-containing protein [Planctomycetota bacterium]
MSNSPTRFLSFVLLAGIAVLVCHARENPLRAAADGKARIAHWTFDETSGTLCRDTAGNGHDAGAGQPNHRSVSRVGGLFGNAINFSGRHDLQVAEKLNFTTLPRISLSAWVMPNNLSGNREIFRKEDGNNRILFSFQGNGSILSLGLNVGGYLECDAEIEPGTVLDGAWHHCAATFDGKTMRVYLDGKEVGTKERIGKITAGGQAKARIGSSSGGECFQGKIDELTIHADALTPQQIVAINRDGIEAMKRASEELKRRLATVYVRKPTFAQTVAGIRRKLVDGEAKADLKLAGMLSRLLRTDFPDDCKEFQRKTRILLPQYLAATDRDAHLRFVEGLMALALEYKPLTEGQWARQTSQQRRQWEELDRMQREFDELKARGESARFSPRWIELMIAAGAKIHFR